MPDYRNINKRILNIEKQGIRPATKLETVRQKYPNLIIPSNQQRGGQIRSLTDVNKERIKAGLHPYDRIEYNTEITDLLIEYGDLLTVSGAKSDLINKLQSKLDDGDINIEVTTKNYKDIYDAVKRAGQRAKDYRAGGKDYIFYELVAEELEG